MAPVEEAPIGNIEASRADQIPEKERRAAPHTQFTIIAATNLAFTVVLTGFFTAFLGLSRVQCLAAIVVGKGETGQ